MAAEQALAKLLDVSEDVVAAVLFDAEGEPVAASIDEDRARSAAATAETMLVYADALRTNVSAQRLEAHTADGSVFVARDGDRGIVAATGPEPATGLVLHDLRTALRESRRRTRSRTRVAS